MSDAVIDVRDLRKTYFDGLFRRRRIEALGGVTFSVEPGEIFGLLGPNGAGKTTMIKVLLGIVKRTSGEAVLLGRPCGDRQARKLVGYLPENHRIPRHLTAYSALEYYGCLSGMSASAVRQKREALLALVGLQGWGRTSVRKFSKGMQQRLGLAQAMLHDPQLLILDEPTDGVDPVGRADIRRILKDLKGQGKTVLINSHLLQEIELVCDRVAILDRGRLQHVGSVAELTHGRPAPGAPSGAFALDVVFSLLADATRVAAAVRGHQRAVVWPGANGHSQLVLEAAEQGTVDNVIDALRAAGISIVRLEPRRRTLEEAFIEIVAEAAQ